MARILISYRIGDTDGQASFVQDVLAQRFGDANVALDEPAGGLPAADRIAGVEVLVVLIGGRWLGPDAETNLLADPTDPVTSLLEAAISGTARPVLVTAPYEEVPAAELPDRFSSLAKRPSIALDEDDLAGSLDPVIDVIDKTLISRGIELVSSDSGLTEQDWETLISNIVRNKVVPFLGGGLSPDARDVRADLAKSWADEMGYPKPADLVDLLASDGADEEKIRNRWAAEFARVVQFVRVKRTDPTYPYHKLSEGLEKLPAPDFAESGSPYRILADLGFPMYLTTNQDRYLEAAIQQSTIERTAISEHYRWSEDMMPISDSPLADKAFRPDAGSPVVYHLYGYSGRDYEDSLILSEDDYLSFVVGVTNEQTTLPPPVWMSLTKNSLMFLGFEWDDLGFRAMLQAILPRVQHGVGKVSPNVSVQLNPGADNAMIEYVRGYFSKMNFSVYLGTPAEFTAELKERWDRAKS
jgi:hypothetical protein